MFVLKQCHGKTNACKPVAGAFSFSLSLANNVFQCGLDVFVYFIILIALNFLFRYAAQRTTFRYMCFFLKWFIFSIRTLRMCYCTDKSVTMRMYRNNNNKKRQKAKRMKESKKRNQICTVKWNLHFFHWHSFTVTAAIYLNVLFHYSFAFSCAYTLFRFVFFCFGFCTTIFGSTKLSFVCIIKMLLFFLIFLSLCSAYIDRSFFLLLLTLLI